MTVFCPLSTQPVFYQGRAQVGAYIRVYDAGSLVPRAVYTTSAETTEYSQPIETDSNGCIPEIWYSGTPVKVRITTPGGVLIREIDNLPGDVETESGGGGSTTVIDVPVGFIMAAHRTGAVDGWVRANGRTIGNASSGALERANADTEDLFTILWTYDSSLSVSGGRGASAAADYAANKTIALPDLRNLSLVGLGDMGGSNRGLLSGATLWNSGAETTLGSYGGAATITLTTAQLASHTHTATTSTAAAHTHTGTTDSGGSHNHTGTATGTAASGGSHSHTHSDYEQKTVNLLNGSTPVSILANQTTDSPATITSSTHSGHTHTASVTIATQAAHTHTITTASGGSHSHTLTTAATGSGSAHNNLHPVFTTTYYIKL